VNRQIGVVDSKYVVLDDPPTTRSRDTAHAHCNFAIKMVHSHCFHPLLITGWLVTQWDSLPAQRQSPSQY